MKGMCSLARSVATLLVLHSLVSSSILAQTAQTRPRRTQPESQPQWVSPPTTSSPIQLPTIGLVAGPEPTIRVALNTSVRSAVISTSGKLMNASGKTSVVALDTSRVRVEARQLSPIPSAVAESLYRVTINGEETRERAEEIEQEIQKATGEEAHEVPNQKTNTWSVVVDKARSREEAEELRATLETLGIDAEVSRVDNSN